jgi:anti-sigma B factor antagonist
LVQDAADFEVTVEVVPGARVVRVRGELDLATTPTFEAAIGAPDDGRLVVDLGECTFVDSSAIRALLRAARSAGDAGGSAAVVAVEPATLRVLEIAGVDQALPVVSSVSDALPA